MTTEESATQVPEPRTPLTYRVYVIELDVAANPAAADTLGWVYVGESALLPEERFAQHLAGAFNKKGTIDLSNKYARRYGLRLMPELYEHLPPLATRQESKREERRLAKRLRKLGYVVEGGT